jgi:hypothetical protein
MLVVCVVPAAAAPLALAPTTANANPNAQKQDSLIQQLPFPKTDLHNIFAFQPALDAHSTHRQSAHPYPGERRSCSCRDPSIQWLSIFPDSPCFAVMAIFKIYPKLLQTAPAFRNLQHPNPFGQL